MTGQDTLNLNGRTSGIVVMCCIRSSLGQARLKDSVSFWILEWPVLGWAVCTEALR